MSAFGRRRTLALVALATSTVIIGLDVTVLNLALPTLAVKLHASSSDLQWFVDAYTLVFAAALLPAGLLGDRYGRKRWLLGGLVMFGLASALCAASGSAGALILARAVLGLAAAVVTSLSIAVLPVMFSAQERPGALAIMFGAGLLAYPLGPLLGGWLLTNFWWGWVFMINVPIVVLALVAVAMFVPESRRPEPPGVDLMGVLVSSAGLAVLTYGMIEAGQKGWGNGGALLCMFAGVGALVVFWLLERRTRVRGEPLVDLALFRSKGFSAGTALATMSTLVMFGLLYAMPQYFREVIGTDAIGAGVRLLPTIGGLLAGLVIATRLQRPRQGAEGGRPGIGPKAAAAFGFAVMTAGVGIGATTTIDSSEGFIAGWFALVGFGLGFVLPTTMNAALGAISRERSGVGSALIMALRFVGATIGVAVLGTLLNNGYRGRVDRAMLPRPVAHAVRDSVAAGVATARKLHSPGLLHTVRAAFAHGLDITLVACSGVGIAALLIALVFLPLRTTVSSESTPTMATAV